MTRQLHLMRITSLLAIVLLATSVALQGFDTLKAKYTEFFGSSASAEVHNAEGHAEHAEHEGGEHHAKHKLIVTSPVEQDVTLTQNYVCQIHSCRHIEVRALEGGYLEEIKVKEGQTVKQGDFIFNILPTIYQAKLDADKAEAELAQVEYDNTKKLVEQKIVSTQELKLAQAKLSKAQAQVNLAQAEVDFANIKAPFDGIIDRLHEQQGSLIEEGDVLTTLSDNSTMWVYFNVPEARYFEYQASLGQDDTHDEAGETDEEDDNDQQDSDHPQHEELNIELMLANHKKFSQPGKIGAIEADFNNETGNISFRADFPNPKGLLRHGQTGTILINRVQKDAIVIPQRATFETLAKKYVYVIGDDDVVHQREIIIQAEKDDIFLIAKGLNENEKIILEGIGQVRDGEKVEYEFRSPEEVLSNLKYHAE